MFTPPVHGFAGSSPLTRGKRAGHARPATRSGLIPAHAGKTSPTRARTVTWRAHPRSRGENFHAQMTGAISRGSSPLTRGKLYRNILMLRDGGLIPAHAGKTSGGAEASGRAWAHPRSRGENLISSACSLCMMGSSPLTRGKPRDRLRRVQHYGLIPAHAGKTRAPHSAPSVARAHPRSRGENSGAGPAFFGVAGSSPLTRGKHHPAIQRVREFGLIPAHAGKTVASL